MNIYKHNDTLFCVIEIQYCVHNSLHNHKAECCFVLVKELYKSRVTANHVQLNRAIIMGAGIMTHNLNKLYTVMERSKKATIDAKHTIVVKFRSILKTCVNDDEKITILKALGNTGLPDFLFDLQQIMEDPTVSAIVRAKGIFSLRKVTPLASKKVIISS